MKTLKWVALSLPLGLSLLAVYAVAHPIHVCELMAPRACKCCVQCPACEKKCECGGKCVACRSKEGGCKCVPSQMPPAD